VSFVFLLIFVWVAELVVSLPKILVIHFRGFLRSNRLTGIGADFVYSFRLGYSCVFLQETCRWDNNSLYYRTILLFCFNIAKSCRDNRRWHET